jgi:hypothetical protein
MKRGRPTQYSDAGLEDLSDDELLLLAVGLVKASGSADQRFVVAVAVAFEMLKELRIAAKSRRGS